MTQLADAAVEQLTIGGADAQRRSAPLAQAQPSLRPVIEVQWQDPGGLYLRLTAQGPWEAGTLLAVAASMSG